MKDGKDNEQMFFMVWAGQRAIGTTQEYQ